MTVQLGEFLRHYFQKLHLSSVNHNETRNSNISSLPIGIIFSQDIFQYLASNSEMFSTEFKVNLKGTKKFFQLLFVDIFFFYFRVFEPISLLVG